MQESSNDNVVAAEQLQLSRDSVIEITRLCAPLTEPQVAIADARSMVREPYPSELVGEIPEWPGSLASALDGESMAMALRLHNESAHRGPLAARVTLLNGDELRMTCVRLEQGKVGCWILSNDPPDPFAEIELVPEEALTAAIDHHGVVLSATDALVETFSRPGRSVIGQHLTALLHADSLASTLEQFASAATPGSVPTERLLLQVADDTYRWFAVSMHIQPGGGRGRGKIIASLVDIDEEVRALAQLRASEQRFQTLAKSLPIGMFYRSDGQTWTNATLRRLLGQDRQGDDWRPLSDGEQAACNVAFERFLSIVEELSTKDVAAARPDNEPKTQTETFDFQCPESGTRTMRITAHLASESGDTRAALIGAVQDVTESVQHSAELARQARTDPLTGVGNRISVEETLTALGSKTVGAIFIDIIEFKEVNNRLGHAAGDDLLRQLADRLRGVVRDDDLVARLGGDEFLVISSMPNEATLKRTAERLEIDLAAPIEVANAVVSPRVSIGAAFGPADQADQLLRHADIARAAQKRRGHGFLVADAELLAHDQRQRILTGQLPKALASDGLELHYQPVVSIHSGAVLGAESLARWNHGLLGPVSPGEFLPLAEQTGRMGDLARWGLQRLLRDLDRLVPAMTQRGSPYIKTLRLGLNLSVGQLNEPGFANHFLSQVEQSGNGDHVLVEVTESHLLEEGSPGERCLLEITDAGIPLAIDDFGTGFSSLAYLTRFPAMYLKLDARYVRELPECARTQTVTAGIVRMCDDLGVGMIAEGIETVEMLNACRNLGIPMGQGFLLARPAPLGETLPTKIPIADRSVPAATGQD